MLVPVFEGSGQKKEKIKLEPFLFDISAICAICVQYRLICFENYLLHKNMHGRSEKYFTYSQSTLYDIDIQTIYHSCPR